MLSVTTEEEKVEVPEAEPVSEAASEESLAPALDIEKKAEAERESLPPMQPESTQVPLTQSEPEPMPESEPEASDSNSEDMVYVEGFGWIES